MCPTQQKTGERALPGGPASREGGREVQTINSETLSGGQWLEQRTEGRQAIRQRLWRDQGQAHGQLGLERAERHLNGPVLRGARWRSGVRVPGRRRTSAEALGGDRLCAPKVEKGQWPRGAHRRAARAVRAVSPVCQAEATGALGRGATGCVSLPKRPRSCYVGFQAPCGSTGNHGSRRGVRSEDSFWVGQGACGGRWGCGLLRCRQMCRAMA